MMRLSQAFVIAALSMLAWAAAACAECSWVLWVSAILPTSGEEVWSVIGAHSRESGGQTACERSAERATKRAEQDEKAKRMSRAYICLPDTVDPRGPKAR
jgi:hypothetical protein